MTMPSMPLLKVGQLVNFPCFMSFLVRLITKHVNKPTAYNCAVKMIKSAQSLPPVVATVNVQDKDECVIISADDNTNLRKKLVIFSKILPQ